MFGEEFSDQIFGFASLLIAVAGLLVLSSALKRVAKTRSQLRQIEEITRQFGNSEFEVDEILKSLKKISENPRKSDTATSTANDG